MSADGSGKVVCIYTVFLTGDHPHAASTERKDSPQMHLKVIVKLSDGY